MAKKENKMNAKEFAHELEKAASFIRQQQAEIEKLKNLVEVQDEKIIDLAFRAVYAERGAEVVAELYIHPKELTDEEITYLAKRFEGVWSGEVDYKGFARATLKKASEK